MFKKTNWKKEINNNFLPIVYILSGIIIFWAGTHTINPNTKPTNLDVLAFIIPAFGGIFIMFGTLMFYISQKHEELKQILEVKDD